MGKFIYVHGRPDHQKGHHDDLIMAISMAIYVGDTSFQSLSKVVNQTKVMIDAWHTSVSDNRNRSDFFNPMIPSGGSNSGRYPSEASKSDYEKYLWLFGK